jgi:hypothetical protein
MQTFRAAATATPALLKDLYRIQVEFSGRFVRLAERGIRIRFKT